MLLRLTGPSHHTREGRILGGGGGAAAGEKHYAGPGTGKQASWELPKGTHRHTDTV